MKYTMTTPCHWCPFVRHSGFTFERLQEHASGEFACHKTCTLVDHDDGDGTVYTASKKSLHCAGALIFLLKQGESTQMMRIAQRLKLFDPSKLDMEANVGNGPADYLVERPRIA
jgi:hypothetical protein